MENVFVHLVFILTVVSIGNILCQVVQTKPDPVISYTCKHDLVVNLKIAGGDYKHIRVYKKDGTLCNNTKQDEDSVLECMKTFKLGQQGKDTVKKFTIIYEDETHKGMSGGQNVKYFTLNCTEQHKNLTAKMQFDVRTDHTEQVENNRKMYVRIYVPKDMAKCGLNESQTPPPVGNTLVPLLNTKLVLTVASKKNSYFIGEPLELELSVPDGYSLLPVNCITSKNENFVDNPYTFWESCNPLDPAIMPGELWAARPKEKSNVYAGAMFAFKFDGTNEVHIRCTATVCPSGDKVACQQPTCNRKRRSAEIQSRTKHLHKYATVSFEVSQYEKPTNKSPGISESRYQYGIMLALSLIVLQL